MRNWEVALRVVAVLGATALVYLLALGAVGGLILVVKWVSP